MDGSRFDHFARTLVTRADRRRVLGGALATALTGMLGVPATAARRKHDKDAKGRKRRQGLRSEQAAGGACAAFCNQLPAGTERGKCQQECVHGTEGGLFDQCGGDITNLCTDVTGALTCECVTTTCTATEIFNFCDPDEFCALFNRLSCGCVPTTEGTIACVDTCFSIDDAPKCESTADCAAIPGAVCADFIFSDWQFCLVPCGEGSTAATSRSSGEQRDPAYDPLRRS